MTGQRYNTNISPRYSKAVPLYFVYKFKCNNVIFNSPMLLPLILKWNEEKMFATHNLLKKGCFFPHIWNKIHGCQQKIPGNTTNKKHCPRQLRHKAPSAPIWLPSTPVPPFHPDIPHDGVYLFSSLSPTQFGFKSRNFRVLAKTRHLRPRNLDFILDVVGCIRGWWVGREIKYSCHWEENLLEAMESALEEQDTWLSIWKKKLLPVHKGVCLNS